MTAREKVECQKHGPGRLRDGQSETSGRIIAMLSCFPSLPSAFCLLPTAFCQLLPAYCLLPTALRRSANEKDHD